METQPTPQPPPAEAPPQPGPPEVPLTGRHTLEYLAQRMQREGDAWGVEVEARWGLAE